MPHPAISEDEPTGRYFVVPTERFVLGHEPCLYYQELSDESRSWKALVPTHVGDPVMIEAVASSPSVRLVLATKALLKKKGHDHLLDENVRLHGVTARQLGSAADPNPPFARASNDGMRVSVAVPAVGLTRAAAVIFVVNGDQGIEKLVCSLDPEIGNGVHEPPPGN